MAQSNPHFDENLVLWSDQYSGRYQPPPTTYSEQFDLQWKLALEGYKDYNDYYGSRTDDEAIDDRIYEWTGIHPKNKNFLSDKGHGNRTLDIPISPELIREKKCIDIGCGMGRWTKTMQKLGASSVLSVDMSIHGLKSVRQFNPNTLQANIMEIPSEHPELVGQFDFGNFWGVAMCTHDPLKAFLSAASTIKSGGSLFLMVYAPEGMHADEVVNEQRKIFHRLKTVEERIQFVEDVRNRKWNANYPLFENIKNWGRNIFNRPRHSRIGLLDLLEPYYNWVISFSTIEGWYEKAGFSKPVLLNPADPFKTAYHVLGKKK